MSLNTKTLPLTNRVVDLTTPSRPLPPCGPPPPTPSARHHRIQQQKQKRFCQRVCVDIIKLLYMCECVCVGGGEGGKSPLSSLSSVMWKRLSRSDPDSPPCTSACAWPHIYTVNYDYTATPLRPSPRAGEGGPRSTPPLASMIAPLRSRCDGCKPWPRSQ